VKMVEKRISGAAFLKLDAPDSGDEIESENGFLRVEHEPGCNWFLSSGNDGTDKFFTGEHQLPSGCRVVDVDYQLYWPKCITASPRSSGRGSYSAVKYGGDDYPNYVHWTNTCWDEYAGKNLYYVISFVISMPEGTELGETAFDLVDNAAISGIMASMVPDDYQPNFPSTPCVSTTEPAHCATPMHEPGFHLPIVKKDITTSPITFLEVFNGNNNGCGGTLTSIKNLNAFTIVLVGNGEHVELSQNTSTTADQIGKLYPSTKFPVTIRIIPEVNREGYDLEVAYDYFQ